MTNHVLDYDIQMDVPENYVSVIVKLPHVPTPAELRTITVGGVAVESLAWHRLGESAVSEKADRLDEIDHELTRLAKEICAAGLRHQRCLMKLCILC